MVYISTEGGRLRDPSGIIQEVPEEIEILRQRIKELEQSEVIHKRTEEVLLESEAKYRAVVESSLAGVFVIQDGLFRFVNERWCEIFGYTYDEAVDKMSPRDLVHPDDKKIIEEDVQKRRSREADRTESEMQAIRKDGRAIVVRVLSSSILYGGRPGSSGTIIDITEHRRVEQELAEKTALLEAQVNASPDGILIINKGKKVLQNQRINDLLKIPKHAAHNDDNETQTQLVKDLFKDPKAFHENAAYVCAHPDETTHDELELKDGTVLDRHSGPVVGEDGKRYGRIWTFRDITERKRSEEELRVSQARLAEAMELANIVYWEIDPGDDIYVLNDPFYSFYGTTAEKEGGYRMTRDEYFKRFVHPDDIPLHRKFVTDNTLRTDTEFFADIEHRIIRRDGEVRYILVRTRIIRDDSGRVIRRYGANQDITERKQAEEALKENEAKYRLLADNAADVIFILDVDMKFKYVSPSVKRLAGFAPEELIGQPISKSMTAESLKLVQETSQEEMKSEITGASDPNRSRILELELLCKDGSTLWTEAKTSALRNAHGIPVGVIGITRDITERKKAEETLRISKLQLSQAMSLADIVYWESDPTDGMFIFNDAFYALYGTTAEREGGYRMSREEYTKRFIHPDDLPNAMPIVEVNAAKSTPGSLKDIEHRIVRRDGEVRHIVVRAEALTNSSGHLIKRYGANQDITQRKHAEEALQIAHQRLFDIIEFLPDATFVIDSDKKVVAWNRACEEMTGVKKEEIIGEGDYAYAVPFYGERRAVLIDYATMDSKELEQKYSSIRKEGNVLHGETFVPRLYNGKGAHIAGESAPLFDRTGKVVGAIESVRDISEFKRLEAQLRQSEKLEAIGTLAGGIAHDFNNILTALSGYGTLLKMAIKDGTLSEYADQVLSASQKAADLVQNLLAFSRQQRISLKPVSLHNIIKGTENLLKRLLTEDIVIKTRFAAKETIVMADETQIDQILFNLATNARDAMPQGGTLTIETQVIELDDEFRHFHGFGKPGRYVLLSISDTGTGIDTATQERMFDPFFTTKATGKGTGLGLSTVYGIVKQHNGYITVYSEPNMGTTFHVYLPAAKEMPKEEISTPATVAEGKEIILIGEDDEQVRKLMSNMLTQRGYTTIEAIDGQDAVEKFKGADTIDLVILDSVMPRMNGRKAYNEIQKIKPDVRVIFMSGYTRDIVLDKGIEEEKFYFLQKPISAFALLQKVRELLDS